MEVSVYPDLTSCLTPRRHLLEKVRCETVLLDPGRILSSCHNSERSLGSLLLRRAPRARGTGRWFLSRKGFTGLWCVRPLGTEPGSREEATRDQISFHVTTLFEVESSLSLGEFRQTGNLPSGTLSGDRQTELTYAVGDGIFYY